MFRSLLAGKSRRKAAILGGALVGVLTPLAAQASLTISLQLAPGLTGATQSVDYITPDNTNQDVPVYVYATVTGTHVANSSNDFDGISYAYYNLNFANVQSTGANAVAINPVQDTASTAFTQDGTSGSGGTAFNFNGSAAQKGSTANTASGIVAGSTTVEASVIKARSDASALDPVSGVYGSVPVWNNAAVATTDEYTNPASPDSVSFLLETIEVNPSAFKVSTTAANGQNYTKLSVSVPTAAQAIAMGGNEFASANWFEDSTSQTPYVNAQNVEAVGSAGSNKDSITAGDTYQASSSFVTFEDVLNGDANHNGTVDVADISTAILHYGSTDPATGTWAYGDFNQNGVVDVSDISAAILDYGQSLVGITPLVAQDLALISAENPGNTVIADALATAVVAVPEPASLSMLALAGVTLLSRQRRITR